MNIRYRVRLSSDERVELAGMLKGGEAAARRGGSSARRSFWRPTGAEPTRPSPAPSPWAPRRSTGPSSGSSTRVSRPRSLTRWFG
jgi:hypothetical protein